MAACRSPTHHNLLHSLPALHTQTNLPKVTHHLFLQLPHASIQNVHTILHSSWGEIFTNNTQKGGYHTRATRSPSLHDQPGARLKTKTRPELPERRERERDLRVARLRISPPRQISPPPITTILVAHKTP